jgi:hypothetical protein
MSKMTLNLKLDHKRNWQNAPQRMERLHRFLVFVKEAMVELEIRSLPPPQEVVFHAAGEQGLGSKDEGSLDALLKHSNVRYRGA